MPVVINATPGSATANSFVTLAEAQTYVDTRLNVTAWTAATTDSTNRALVEATRTLCGRDYVGRRVDTTQVLEWPRWYAVNPDAPIGGQWYYSTTIIPDRIKDATCELALQFIIAGTSDVASLDSTLNTRVKTVDVLTTEYFEPQLRAKGLARFPRVMDLIRPLLAGGGTTELIRG